MNGLIYVDSVELECIANATFGWYDVSKNSGRDVTNANGDMILNVINQKRKLEITTIPMNQTQLQNFFQKIKLNTTFTVNFFDPYTGQRKECSMYRGDRSVSLKYKNENGTLYEPITISLIEL